MSGARQRNLAAITVGGSPKRLDGPVDLAPPDADWPAMFEALAARVRLALRAPSLAVHHVGSTSVAGLAAKPVIDMIVEVGDSAEEAAYVPPLERAGFALAIREPAWFEHRMLRAEAPAANLHVFTAGCAEVDRMLAFRDRLRASPADLALYEATKRALAARTWAHTQDYADAKTAVVGEILQRADLDGPTSRKSTLRLSAKARVATG